jgi:pyruvate-ferredoxin/flavodoxin oxidoreductase
MWASSVLKLYRRLFGTKIGNEPLQSGVETVLDGATAVAVAEACVAEVSGPGGSFPADAAARVWEAERARQKTNFFGGALASLDAAEPRGAFASVLGSSLSGLRATAFVSGPDLIRIHDLLRVAAGRHAPLVVHVGARATDAHAASQGSGHEAYHAVADHGGFQLFARNVQQAVDFALVARRTAERALLPGLVAMDSEQTALSVQDVHLPPPELVGDFLGSPQDLIATPTGAQKLLFGNERRRVPLSFDLDRPVLEGGFQNSEAWALGLAGQTPFFHHHLLDFIEDGLKELGEKSGRKHSLVSSSGPKDAPLVLVAQGSAIEVAEAFAAWAFEEKKQKVGVVGIQGLRPFPAAQVLERLRGKRTVVALERVGAPLGSETPLLRELRSAVDRARENNRFGADTHGGYPAWADKDLPKFHSVSCGLGGHPLRGADLALLCSEIETKGRAHLYLGIDFAPESSPYPKRQALIDQIRREYPKVEQLAVRSKENSPDTRPDGSLTVAVHRPGPSDGEGLAEEAAALLHHLVGGQVRSRPSSDWSYYGAKGFDIFTHSVTPLLDPGDDITAEIVIVPSPGARGVERPLARLNRGGTVIVLDGNDLSDPLRIEAVEREARVISVSAGDDTTRNQEYLLGALASRFLSRFELKPKRISGARAEMLRHLDEEAQKARLEWFESGLEEAGEVSVSAVPEKTRTGERDVPMAVRVLGQTETTVDSVPRFWDQVGVLYQNGETSALSSDPYLATGAIPPLTSTFADKSTARNTLPVLEPGKCTGCGACWTWCPDGAVAPLAITPAALLESGMKKAGADALRPAMNQLASRVTTEIKKADPAPARVGEILDKAFDWLLTKMPMDDDRKKATQEAFDNVRANVGELVIAKTAPFFDEPETRSKGTGELFSLAINPDACKGCGICVQVCEPEALTEEKQSAENLEQARTAWRLWEQLPDTPGTTIDRVRENPDVGPTAAILLSRHCLSAMAGGDGAEAGSGEKLALRLFLAASEYHQQPRVRQLAEQIGEARQKLAEKIRETLANALPTSDLDALADGLDFLGNRAADLPTLMERVHGAVEHGRVDGKLLRRQVETTQQLADLHERLTRGPSGMGRGRMGMAVAADTANSWLGAFPDNPFSIPVVVDTSGNTASLARGLLEGQMSIAIDASIALRKAELELERPQEAEVESASLGELTWRDLSDEERRACPQLLLVGSDEALAANDLAPLLELLQSEIPVKVMAFSRMDMALDAAPRSPRLDLAFTALGLQNVFVAQTSISYPEHFYESVRNALAHSGPALVRVHTPNPERHGFDSRQTVEQALLTVRSRAFPLFRYDPAAQGIFGLCLDLAGNSDTDKVWCAGGEGPYTPAHWALTESRFASHIKVMTDDAPGPTPVADYLLLSKEQRIGKTPFVEADDRRMAISDELADTLAERVALWRTLQEIAGIVTPFTERVRMEAERSVAAEHQADLQKLRDEYEAKIKALGEEKQSEIAQKIKNQLLILTGYKK